MTFRWTALGLVLAALVWSCQQRRQLVVELAGLREPPGLLEPADEGPGVRASRRCTVK